MALLLAVGIHGQVQPCTGMLEGILLCRRCGGSVAAAAKVMSVRDDVAVRVSRLNDFRSDRLSSINTAPWAQM